MVVLKWAAPVVALVAMPLAAAGGLAPTFVGRDLRSPPPPSETEAEKSAPVDASDDSPSLPAAVWRHLDFISPSSAVVFKDVVDASVRQTDSLSITLPLSVTVDGRSLGPPWRVTAVLVSRSFEGEFRGRLVVESLEDGCTFTSGKPQSVRAESDVIESSCWFFWADQETLAADPGCPRRTFAARRSDLGKLSLAVAYCSQAPAWKESGGGIDVWVIYEY